MNDFSDKVMIVDDNAAFLRLCMESMIDLENREVLDHIILCGSVDEAVTKYAIHRPLVVLIDIKMPGKNGIEGAKLLREIDPNARICFLSNYPNDPEAAHAIDEHLAMGVMDKAVGTGVIAAIVAFITKLAIKMV